MQQNKDYIQSIEGAERRFFTSPVTVEQRGEGDDALHVIEGYAFKFGKVTTIGGWFREEILAGAADDNLNDDIRCLFNHDPSLILARSVNGKGTLTLTIDEVGLKYSYTTPNRSYALDLQDAIESGDVDKSSFAFKAKETIWVEGSEGEPDLRQIKKFDVIWDVSPVTYPAYQDTSVAKRSHDAYLEERANQTDVNDAEEVKTETRADKLDVYEAQHIFNKNNS